jgi:hypothetical protein
VRVLGGVENIRNQKRRDEKNLFIKNEIAFAAIKL